MIRRKLVQENFTIFLLIMCLVTGSLISALCEEVGDYLPLIQEFLVHSPRLNAILTDDDKELFSIVYWQQEDNDNWLVTVMYAGIYSAAIELLVDSAGHISFVDQYYQDYFLFNAILSISRSRISRIEVEKKAKEAFLRYIAEQQGTTWLNNYLERYKSTITEDDFYILTFYFGSSSSSEGVWDCIIIPSMANEGKNFFCDEMIQWGTFRIDAYSLDAAFSPVNN